MSFALQRASFDPLVISWIGTAVAVGYAAYLTYTTSKKLSTASGCPINLDIQKDKPKVVDNVDVEDLGNKAVFCRCWRSKKFPYCDGAHAKHNQATGDNQLQQFKSGI